MDCADCARHVQQALVAMPGVAGVEVLLTAEKAIVHLSEPPASLPALRQAVSDAGYSSPVTAEPSPDIPLAASARTIFTFFGVLFGVVLFVVVIGEWLGLLETITKRLPWPLMLAAILVGGYPIFRNVLQATRRRQITAHTMMTLGMLAALVVGEWAAAAVVVFFMRVGDYTEKFTADRARHAVKDLTRMAPQTARVVRDGNEQEVPVGRVQVGDVVVVRPGEKVPVDGRVIDGQATVDQAAITGESMPVEVGPGAAVFAAAIARLGSIRVQATHVGEDSTFGRVIKLVEEAELHRADVQRLADRFAGYYLPVVATVAALTFLLSGNALATAAVLLVACSCSFALATPVAVMAAIGAGAKQGLLVKGGKYLETLARADVLLIDKTGTLTLGQPQITQVQALNGLPEEDLLTLAATAERYSEHPLAEAVRQAAVTRGLSLADPYDFEAIPGLGVRARVNGHIVTVGSRRLATAVTPLPDGAGVMAGQTRLYVTCDDELVGVLAAADIMRPEVPQALAALPALGIKKIELLTGDHEETAARLATSLGIAYRAELLPQDKIAIVKAYQAQGHTVIMVGDGVNDAPALAQADVGIAMGVAGTDVAIEAAHVALMRDDWRLVPLLIGLARRTLGVVRMNLWFTAVYNLLGLTLAAFGFLPPALAAAAQSIPDLGILGNSSRLLKAKRDNHAA
jgi:P-type Cu+ transporter